MARRWTIQEERLKRRELVRLYVKANRSISEIGRDLGLAESSVYDRLIRLEIKTNRAGKIRFNNKRHDISIPGSYSIDPSEFVGILLGDGHLTPTQITVTLGNKEKSYVNHVAKLIKIVFKIKPRIFKSRAGYYVIYFGSTDIVRWLCAMGLVFNKVKSQVNIPKWIFSRRDYLVGFLRGFFDTDGSIYKLRFGVQIAFINRSLPMLHSTREGLILLGFYPSQISQFKVYLTRREDIIRFPQIINPFNSKHIKRLLLFTKK